MSVRGPRLEFAVGAFLLLALASLLVLALASTNGKFGFGGHTYPLKARFTNLGQLRTSAPVKIGGVVIGNVADIQLDPAKFDAVVTLAIDDRYKDLPADTSAGILTGGLLGESYIGLQPGGDVETLKPDVKRDRAHLERMLALLAAGAVRPPAIHRYKLADAAEAHKVSEGRHLQGKLVLDVR